MNTITCCFPRILKKIGFEARVLKALGTLLHRLHLMFCIHGPNPLLSMNSVSGLAKPRGHSKMLDVYDCL